MDGNLSIGSNFPEGIASAAGTSARTTEDAARQFEALILAQLLKAAREDSSTDSGNALGDYAEQEFSNVLASAGGLGLAKLVVSGLETSTKAPSVSTSN